MINIRYNTFETNSSSTHSLSIVPSNLDAISLLQHVCDAESFIHQYESDDIGDTWTITLQHIEDGDEEEVAITRFQSYEGKLSYVFMQMFDIALDEYLAKNDTRYETIYENVFNFLKTKNYYMWFTERLTREALKHNKKVEIEMEDPCDYAYPCFVADCGDERPVMTKETIASRESFNAYVDMILDENTDIVHVDTPYNGRGRMTLVTY